MASSDDDKSLPALRSRSSSLASTSRQRKRSYDNFSDNSSDAPFFSSDDLADASLDNYEVPRRKRLHRRAWWETEDDGKRSRRARKAKDSGVFMSSDTSNDEDGFNVPHAPSAPPALPKSRPPRKAASSMQRPASGDERIRAMVRKCVEDCNETIDLSGQQIEEISDTSLQPLQHMIRRSHVNNAKDEHAFRPLAPQQKLFLYDNALSSVPGVLSTLENLTVLSLRRNKISELPQSIGRLGNLVELNVAVNELRYLPWEILPLVSGGKLAHLHVRPNRFFQPFPSTPDDISSVVPETLEDIETTLDTLRAALAARASSPPSLHRVQRLRWAIKIHEIFALRMRAKPLSQTQPQPLRALHQSGNSQLDLRQQWARSPILCGATKPAIFGVTGVPRPTSPPAPSTLPQDQWGLPMTDETAATLFPLDEPSVLPAPSLFELVLRTCASSATPLGELLQILPSDYPDSLAKALTLAKRVVAEGGRICPHCKQPFIQPRAEWIEYWHCAPDNMRCDASVLPFLKQACSLSCARSTYCNEDFC